MGEGERAADRTQSRFRPRAADGIEGNPF